MPLPSGAIIEATIVGTVANQTVMNVWHYRVDTQSTIPLVSDEVIAFNTAWRALGANSFHTNFLLCMPNNYETKMVVSQAISPQRYIRYAYNSLLSGERETTLATNLQASVTFQSALAGRSQVGGKRFLLGTSDCMEGRLGTTIKEALATFCDNMKAPVTALTGGGIYKPVIYHRKPELGAPSTILNCIVQDQARIIRRRTVGLGI